MKEVVSIDIILENCEVIRVNREHIGYFCMSDVKKSIVRIGVNSISDFLQCDELYIEICSKVNHPDSYVSTRQDNDILPFDRILRYNDITSLDINYEDGSSECISVKWDEDSFYSNSYQTSKMNEFTGDLYIVVSDKVTADEYS